MKTLAAVLALVMLTSATPAANGPVYSGIPPARYWGEGVAVTLYVNDVAKHCPIEVPSGHVLLGCAYRTADGVPVSVLPNPCFFDMEAEMFARIACHEKGHQNGWRGEHPL